MARAVGVPLAVVTIDAQGKLLHRKQNFVKAAVAGQGEITIQLPEQAVAVVQPLVERERYRGSAP